jgi:multidrug resistance efflux pump
MKTQSEADRFREFAKRIISVPKAEIDKRQAEYQKAKAARKAKA